MGEKKNKRIIILVLVALCALLSLTAVGVVLAKYVFGIDSNVPAVASNFYFESDLLTASGTEYTVSPGAESIVFKLNNHADALRYTNRSITYTYSITVSGGTEVASGSGTLAGVPNGFATVTYAPVGGLTPGESYTVTAVGVGGYEKTLTATFNVKSASPALYKSVDLLKDDAYVLLTVWSTENVACDVRVEYPAGLIPDNTAPGMGGALAAVGSGTASFTDDVFNGAYVSRTYRFFYASGKLALTADDFTVKTTDGNYTATPAIPK